MNIGAAISKPFSNIVNLIIGLVLFAIPLINILTIPGYLLRVAKRTMAKDNKLPGFDNFVELVVDSIKVLVVGIVYGIIGMIIFFILNLIPLIGGILALVFYIALIFIVMSATMTLAKTGDIGAAFGFSNVIKKAFEMKFLVPVLVAIIISGVVLGVILLIIGVIAGASLLPALLAGGDPTAMAATLMGLFGSLAIGFIVMYIVSYIMSIFVYTMAAEAYQQ